MQQGLENLNGFLNFVDAATNVGAHELTHFIYRPQSYLTMLDNTSQTSNSKIILGGTISKRNST